MVSLSLRLFSDFLSCLLKKDGRKDFRLSEINGIGKKQNVVV
jgi:hypothetical protein